MELNFNQEKEVYVIDTSALIILEYNFKYDNPVFAAIWEEIEELIKEGLFRTIDFVEDEINNYQGKEDFLKKWIKKWQKKFVVSTDIESINASIPIINQEYKSGLFDAKKIAEGKEEADPYLIGYCKTHKCILITMESKLKPNKLPFVAAKNNVKCIDINEFLVERGLRMIRKER